METRTRPHVFFAAHKVLNPLRSAGDVVLEDELNHLESLGCRVFFSSLDLLAGTGPEAGLLSTHASTEILSGGPSRSPDLIVQQMDHLDIAYLCFWGVADQFLPPIKRRFPRAAIVFNPVDLHFLRNERARAVGFHLHLPNNLEEAKEGELSVIRQADVTFVYNELEKSILAELVPEARVEYCPWTLPVSPGPNPFRDRHSIAFLGNFNHLPNLDAVHFIAEQLLPALHRRAFTQAITVCGNLSREKVGHLSSERLAILGEVDNLESLYDRCRVSIAPLRFGAGKKGKVAQAMARGVPTVLTGIAAEGFDLENGRDAIIVETADEIAEAIIKLYHDERLWNHISGNALSYVERNFNPVKGQAFFRNLLSSLC